MSQFGSIAIANFFRLPFASIILAFEIGFLSNCNLSKALFGRIQGLEFEQQITLFRDYVLPMGAEAKAGAEI